MRSVLYNIMPRRQENERDRRERKRDIWTSGKRQSRSLAQPHRREEDESLVEQDPRQCLAIAEAIVPAQLEPLQCACPVAPLECCSHPVKYDHMPGPDNDGDRESKEERQGIGKKVHEQLRFVPAGRVAKSASHHGALTPKLELSSRK